MQVTMLGIVRSNVLQLLFKSLVLVWSERMDSLDADTLHKQGSVSYTHLDVYKRQLQNIVNVGIDGVNLTTDSVNGIAKSSLS